ncbi:unnamed protein product, partial [Mesorhabditis spiculigera]
MRPSAATPTMNRRQTMPAPSAQRQVAATPARNSVLPGAAFGVQSARRSSFFKGSSVLKDPRPLSDGMYRAEMVRKLHNFLRENCGAEISEKTVRSPGAREFVLMFENIYQHLSPTFKVKGRMEEEIPRVFAKLGYPFPLKSSTLQTVGASHSIPHVLGALCWLVDLVQITLSIQPSDVLLGSKGHEDSTKATLKYMLKQNVFKSEAGAKMDPAFYEGKVAQLRAQLRSAGEHPNIEEAKERLELAKTEYDTLMEEAGEGQLKCELHALQGDLRVQRQFVGELELENRRVLEQVAALKSGNKNREELQQQLLTQIEEKQMTIQRQTAMHKITPEQARAIKGEIASFRSQISSLRAELDDVGKNKWKEGPLLKNELFKYNQMFDEWVREVHDLKRAIDGHSVAVQSEHHEPLSAQALFQRVTQDCPKMLRDARKELEDVVRQIRSRTGKCKQDIDSKKVDLKSLQRQNETKKKEAQLEERKRTREREQWDNERKGLEVEIENLQLERVRLVDKKTEASRLDTEIKQAQAALKAQEGELEDYVTAVLYQMLDEVAALSSGVDEQKAMLVRTAESNNSLVEAVLELDLDAQKENISTHQIKTPRHK